MSENKNVQEVLINQVQSVFDQLLASNTLTDQQRIIYSMVSHNLKNPEFQKMVFQAQQNPQMLTELINGQNTTNTETV